MKLLLADDHRLFRDSLVQYMKRADIGAQIDVSDSLDGALDFLSQDAQYDLVILDLRMPGMHGMAGFEKMRTTYPNTPAAMISGVAEEPDVIAAFDLGAVG
jgi:two-component system nitrate/nitrite response regulator NarL